MNHQRESRDRSVQEGVEEIVRSGIAISDRVAGLVSRAAVKAQDAGKDLGGVAQEAVTGALDAVEERDGSSRSDQFEEVIQGLAHGFSNAALTARLAIEEATSKGRAFAETDLQKMRSDLETLSSLYAETISQGIHKLGDVSSTEFSRLSEHAQAAAERLKPALAATVDAVREHPLESAQDAAQASGQAVMKTAGSLFSMVGEFLSGVGERLNRS